jgi:hypothetical protein
MSLTVLFISENSELKYSMDFSIDLILELILVDIGREMDVNVSASEA